MNKIDMDAQTTPFDEWTKKNNILLGGLVYGMAAAAWQAALAAQELIPSPIEGQSDLSKLALSTIYRCSQRGDSPERLHAAVMGLFDSSSQAPVVQRESAGDDWITAQVARHLDMAYRNGVSAGWNAGVDGDGKKLAKLKNRVGTRAEYAALFPDAVTPSPQGDAEDAARYRWIKSKTTTEGRDGGIRSFYQLPNVDRHDDTGKRFFHDGLDAAVDAARKVG